MSKYIRMSIKAIKAGQFDTVTSIKNIKDADAAFIFKFHESKNAGWDRYQVYLRLKSGKVLALWAGTSDLDNYKDDIWYLLPSQVHYSGKADYPPFHFALFGGQYNKKYEIALDIKAINENIKIFDCSSFAHPSIMEVR